MKRPEKLGERVEEESMYVLDTNPAVFHGKLTGYGAEGRDSLVSPFSSADTSEKPIRDNKIRELPKVRSSRGR